MESGGSESSAPAPHAVEGGTCDHASGSSLINAKSLLMEMPEP